LLKWSQLAVCCFVVSTKRVNHQLVLTDHDMCKSELELHTGSQPDVLRIVLGTYDKRWGGKGATHDTFSFISLPEVNGRVART
jgi:hypothetical protein